MNPEETTTPTTEPSEPVATVVQLDQTQYDTFIQQSNTINLLTNRVEFLLFLNITIVAFLLYNLMRSKS